MAYGEALPTDSASKKFEGVLVNNGGVNEFVPKSGYNRRLQNGEVVADENVNVRNHITGGISGMDHFTLNTAADEQELTVDDTVGGVQFTAFDAATTHVLITVSGGEVYFTLRGTAPTYVKGHRIFPHDGVIWHKSLAAAAKFIRGYDAVLDGKLYLTELIERALLTTT